MNTLIAYATKYGSTEGCARILAEKLTGKVDLCNLKTEKAGDLAQYDNVIIGSAIYMSKAQNIANEFCIQNLDQLKEKKLGFYICCMYDGEKAELQLNNAFPLELLARAVARESFGGEFRIKSMKFTDKFIVKMVAKMDKNLPSIHKKQDISTISEDALHRFAQMMSF